MVLNSVAENLYNESVSLFTNGNYIGARARLARLTEVYSKGSSVQKVGDLDARLKALGY